MAIALGQILLTHQNLLVLLKSRKCASVVTSILVLCTRPAFEKFMTGMMESKAISGFVEWS